MQGWKWLANPTFGNNSATFTWHARLPKKKKINSTVYFAVILINKNSKSNNFILLAPTTGLLCYTQITIINMNTEIFS